MSATARPARSIVGELAVDVVFAAGARGKRGDHREHVRRTRSSADGSNEHFNLAVQLVDLFDKLDVPAVQRSANHNTAFHVYKSSLCAGKVVGKSH